MDSGYKNTDCGPKCALLQTGYKMDGCSVLRTVGQCWGELIASDGRLSVHNVSPYITYLPRKDGGDRSKQPSFSNLFIFQGR